MKNERSITTYYKVNANYMYLDETEGKKSQKDCVIEFGDDGPLLKLRSRAINYYSYLLRKFVNGWEGIVSARQNELAAKVDERDMEWVPDRGGHYYRFGDILLYGNRKRWYCKGSISCM